MTRIKQFAFRILFVQSAKLLDVPSANFYCKLSSLAPEVCHFIRCDMSSEVDIKNLIDKTVEKFGQIDCLINNAGTHPPALPIDEFSVQDFKDLLNINLVRLDEQY